MIFDSLHADRFVTDFGDGAVLLPVFGVSIILFAAFGWTRGAVIWGGVSGIALALLMTAKFAGLEWAYFFNTPGKPLSVSGHVAAGSAIYGSLLNLLIFREKKNVFYYFVIPVMIASALSYTRLVLHSHTPDEVTLGAALGVSVALISSRALVPMPRRLIIPMFAIMLMVIISFYGDHSHTEALLQSKFSAWASEF